jgi:glycosyltransferase involved in cell wall biosynthesis
MLISVIICTHNPRADYLFRVIEALKGQTLSKECWELLLVDNASRERLEDLWELSWHSNARHLREDELGLTPARLRGIRESRGELLVFVDDDNVLASDYLEEAWRVAKEWPILGAWGGNIAGEFEVDPEPWTKPFWGYLALRDVERPIWSNNPDDWRALPSGAGLCARATVAHAYDALVRQQPSRRALDRVGSSLSSCGDTDLVLCGGHLGLGFGSFPLLRLTHLIPAYRLNEDYLVRLLLEMKTSALLLGYLRSGVISPRPPKLKEIARYVCTFVSQGRRQARIQKASQDATRISVEIICGLDRARKLRCHSRLASSP